MFDPYRTPAEEIEPARHLAELDDLVVDDVFKAVLRRVYLWMALGLLVTTGTAFATAFTPLGAMVFSNIYVIFGLFIGELILVAVLSAGDPKTTPLGSRGDVLRLCRRQRDHAVLDLPGL